MKLLRKNAEFLKRLRPGLAVVCFLAAVLLLSGCGQEDALLSELRRENANGASGPEGDWPDGAAEAGRSQGEKVWVHVCGAVKSPGVYELPAGSRFYEAVEAAGGFAENACEDYLNLAAVLSDGSRLEIPTLEEIAERKASEKEDGLVNINTADAEKLCSLPGVGEGRAKAIVEYREKQGGFQKKEDIMQVSGIGEKMYERMEAYLTVE